MLCDKIKKIKSNWYWYLFFSPLCVGLICILLALTKVVDDIVREDGVLIEYGYRTFVLGLMLVKIGIAGLIAVLIIKRIHRFYKNLKKS
jgi:mannose/fructose/N-acetylgalactosamine-specific phosphotransferase system component IIC